MIKKNLVLTLIIILCFSQFSFGQSKKETEEWIKTIIEDVKYRFNSYHNYEITFSNGNLIIKQPFLSKYLFESIVPLKSLGKIKLRKDDDGYKLTLSCKDGECIKDGEYLGENFTEYKFNSYSTSTSIVFGVTFQNDELPERLKKAFKHIVQLYGGKLVGEAF